jgi:hypothetical protein
VIFYRHLSEFIFQTYKDKEAGRLSHGTGSMTSFLEIGSYSLGFHPYKYTSCKHFGSKISYHRVRLEFGQSELLFFAFSTSQVPASLGIF